MNTTYSINDDIQAKIQSLLANKSEEDLINEDAHILMDNYLSEIERIIREDKLNKKELAQKIDISASYLTQVFKGDKPLNFYTLAKIKRALKLRFEVSVSKIGVSSFQKIEAASLSHFMQASTTMASSSGQLTFVMGDAISYSKTA